MLLLRTNATFANANLPVYNPSAAELALSSIPGLVAWLEGGDAYVSQDGSGNVSAWVDRISGRRFVPIGASPRNIGFGTQGRKGLRFGFGGSLTVSDNGALRAEDDADLIGSAGYAMSWLARVPVPASAGGTEVASGNTGGIFLGNRDATGSYFQVMSEPGTRNFVARNASTTSGNANLVRNASSSPPVTPDDGAWHYYTLVYDLGAKLWTLRFDGVQNATLTQNINVQANAGSKQLLIGNAGTSGLRLIGDMAGIMVVKDRIPTGAEISTIESYLAAIKAGLSA